MNQPPRWPLTALLTLTWALTPSPRAAWADPPTPGNILVSTEIFGGSSDNTVREFTRAGTLVQTFGPVPTGPGGDGSTRDLYVDGAGRVQIFNGTFSPYLTTLTPAAGPGSATYAQTTLPGWSTVNNLTYGGVAVQGNAAFVTDMATFSGGEPRGLVRFNLSTGVGTRFASTSDYT